MADQVDCPMCFRPFAVDQIERHAANCNGLDDASPATGGFSGGGGGATRPGGGGGGGGRGGAGRHDDLTPAPCPICSVQFPAAFLQEHAQHCTGFGGGGGDVAVEETNVRGRCHAAGCPRPGNASYAGFCMVCLNKRGGMEGLRPVCKKKISLNGRSIEVCQGDLTRDTSDCIVNPANRRLDHGSGVAGAIREAASPQMEVESKAIVDKLPEKKLNEGEAVITSAGGRLIAKQIIHTVGPMWGGGNQNEAATLKLAITNTLRVADEHSILSLAIPAVSSGIFGFPKDLCATILIEAVYAYLNQNPQSTIRTVKFTNIDDATVEVFLKALGDEPRPLMIVQKVVGGSEENGTLQRLAVVNGTTYQVQRTTNAQVAVVDFANQGWDYISPFCPSDAAKAEIQQAIRDFQRRKSNGVEDSAIRTIPLLLGNTYRVVVVGLHSNRFDEASASQLGELFQEAIFFASTANVSAIAVPLLGAAVLGYSNFLIARYLVRAAFNVLQQRCERGQPSLDIILCESIDTDFLAKELRVAVVPHPDCATSSVYVEQPKLTFQAAVEVEPAPANETPAQRRERLRRAAEAKMEMRLAAENPS